MRASSHVLEPKALGFTADGRTFVYVERNSQTTRDDYKVRAVVRNLDTATEHEYLYERDENSTSEPLAFQQWLKKNPVRCAGGPRSPDGTYALRVLFTGTAGVRGGWQRQMYLFSDGQHDSEQANLWGHLRVLLEQGRKSYQLDKTEVRGEWRLSGGLIPCWSPDGKRLALISFREGQGMRDQGEMDVRFVALGSEIKWEFPPLRL